MTYPSPPWKALAPPIRRDGEPDLPFEELEELRIRNIGESMVMARPLSEMPDTLRRKIEQMKKGSPNRADNDYDPWGQ